jgi:hypothetical protein
MGVIRDLYWLKVKVFLGAIKSSRASVLLIAVYTLGLLPTVIGTSFTVVNVVKSGVDITTYLNLLASIFSGVFILMLLTAFRGYIAYEYEQNLIFTSPVTPRTYLIVSLLADVTVLSIFLYPILLFLGVIIASLQLSILSTLSIIASLALFFLFIYFTKTSLSILESLRQDSLIRDVLTVMVVLLLLPNISFIIPFPIKFSELPYPSTLVADVMLNSMYEKLPSIGTVFGLVFYFLISSVAFLFCSSLNFFQYTKSIPLVSPFDTSMRVQTIKTGKNIKFFSRFGFQPSLSLNSKSLLNFLMKKEFVRMVRDGSVFMVLILYIVLTIISIATRSSEASFPMWIFLLSFYSFIVPSMLVSNWRIVELDTLWIPLTSGVNFGVVAKAVLYDFTLTAFIVPALTTVFLAFINNIDPIVPLVLVASASIIGSSANLFTMIRFLSKKRRATPAIMINWLSVLLSGILILPAYIFALLSLILGFDVVTRLLFTVPTLAYSAFVFWFLSKKIEQKALNIEI